MSDESHAQEDEHADAGSTAPGERFLKSVWGIEGGKRSEEKAPTDVSTDIYSMPTTPRRVPPRHRGQ